MNPLPLPAHVHYELLLQLLEQQSMAVMQEMTLDPTIDPVRAGQLRSAREYLHTTLVMIRKALVAQKQLEEICAVQGIPVSYRWSLNEIPEML